MNEISISKSKEANKSRLDAIVREKVLSRIDAEAAVDVPRVELYTELNRLVGAVADEERIPLNEADQSLLVSTLLDDIIGIGPLGPLLASPGVSDILVNGPFEIFIETGGKLIQTDAKFRDQEHAIFIAQRIASAIGRRVDESSPMLDARLEDGSRVNILFPPLAVRGPYMSIRKFSKDIASFDTLVDNNSLTPMMAKALALATRCRLNIVISGGTGAGKTTLLNVMAQHIANDERVITIEDVAELKLMRPHVLPMETRPANIEGTGEVVARDLIRNALRMRPDRIIISECRGEETFDMLQAMNTGHRGSMTTLHANTPYDAIARIEQMVQMSSARLPNAAIRSQISSAVDMIIQVERMRDGVRRVTGIHALNGVVDDEIRLMPLWQFRYAGEDNQGKIISNFVATLRDTKFDQSLDYYGALEAFQAALAEDAAAADQSQSGDGAFDAAI